MLSGKNITVVLVAVSGLIVALVYAAWNVIGGPEEFTVSGIIEADDVHVGSKVGGRVLKVVAREGQQVKSGEVLLLLEPYELNASLSEAQAGLRQAQAKLAEVVAGYRREEVEQAEAAVRQYQEELDRLLAGPRTQEIDQARAEWLAAKAQYENAEKFRQRMKDLVERQLVAAQDYDDAEAKAQEAEQRMHSASERYDLLRAGTRREEIAQARYRLAEADAKLRQFRSGRRREEIDQSRAAVEMSRARVELLETHLNETVIKAPVDSLVEVLDMEPGDLVSAGKPIATLLRTDSLWVRAYLPEDRLGYVQPGQKVEVRVDSFPRSRFAGAVRRIRREGEFTPRNIQTTQERVLQVFQMEVVLEDPQGLLRPGMNADVSVPVKSKFN